jgi:hypothetical protein
MFMEDAGEVARWLAQLGVRLVLHGHYHVADLVGVKFWNSDASNTKAETIVVSAGSATAIEPEDGHNSCHLIQLAHFRTAISKLLLDHGEYQKVQDARSFIFDHRPELRIEGSAPDSPPAFLEALEASVVGEEHYADQLHKYEAVDSTGYIDADRTYFGSVEMEGINDSSSETTHLPFLVTAVGAQEFSHCDCRAWDMLSGQELSRPELLLKRPIHVFPCRVYFADPLIPKGKFKIRVQFHLPMVMLEQRDFDMLNTIRFQRGLSSLRMRLVAEKTIVAPSCWELRSSRLRQSSVPVTKLAIKPPYPEMKGAVGGYEISIASPNALSYLLFYEKLV